MKAVKLLEPFPERWEKSIFIFTSTEYFNEIQNHISANETQDTIVFLPFCDEEMEPDVEAALEWEKNAISFADILLFWLPANIPYDQLKKIAVYFGKWASSRKIIYGRECVGNEADEVPEKFSRLDLLARRSNITIHRSHQECLNEFQLKTQNAQETRSIGERLVPLYLWNDPSFKFWYDGMRRVGNRLDGVNFEWVKFNGNILQNWALHVDVWVKDENRNKSNEVVVGKPNVGSVFAYHIPEGQPTAKDCDVVLIRQFHLTTKSSDCFVRKLPGGSDITNSTDPKRTAADQLAAQLGLSLSEAELPRLQEQGQRQLAGTTCTQQLRLLSIQLTAEEIEHCRHKGFGGPHEEEKQELKRVPHSVAQNDNIQDLNDYSYVEVLKFNDVMQSRQLDWSTLGMMHYALHRALNRSKVSSSPQMLVEEKPSTKSPAKKTQKTKKTKV